MDTYRTVTLTEAEMTALDDGQGWYKAGDDVAVAGYVDRDGVDLNVNGETVCDGWTTWDELPASIRQQATDPVFGKVLYGGNVYHLSEEASLTNRVFHGWFGDADDGETYTTEYSASAFDSEGAPYRVYWQFDVIKGQEPEDEGDYPWTDEHISAVEGV